MTHPASLHGQVGGQFLFLAKGQGHRLMLVRRCLSQRRFLLRALPESLPFPTQASCCLPGNVLPGPLFVRRFRYRSHLARRCELRAPGRLGLHD